MKTIVIKGKLYKWHGPSAWYFLSSTKKQGEDLRSDVKKRVGWGSRRVKVAIGETVFNTSLFPTKEGPYLLPVKASVRKQENLNEGSTVTAVCSLM
ncbi:MAG: DUF1905 domain-containing protein [Rectinemataceae bacterium]|nr:DUF1905 domain-containing protein [Rectinemataceae bacterium]